MPMEVPCFSLCLEVEVMSKVPGSFLAVGLGLVKEIVMKKLHYEDMRPGGRKISIPLQNP